MAHSMQSRFRKAYNSGDAKGVLMNAFDIAFFSQSPHSVGTDSLGSCSVVLIVSSHAALLGHVSPLPDNANPNDPLAGDNHVRSFMDRLTKYYLQHQQYFPRNPHSWVVCAIYRGSVALPDQQTIMETKLRDVGLNVDISKTYQVPTLTDHFDRGSVFVDASGSTVQVYVEGTLVQEIQVKQKVSASTISKATGSAPAESQWDGQYYVSTENPAYVWINGAWSLKPSTISTASQASGTAPAKSQWDGQYYVSTENPAYVWINGTWTIRP